MPSSDPAKRREQQARRRATKKQAASDGAAGAFHQHQAAAGTSTSVGNSSSSNDPGAADQPSSTGLLSETEAELQRQERQREILTAEFEPEQSAEPLPAWRAKHRPPTMHTMPDGEERVLPRLADYWLFGKPDLHSAAAKEWGYQPGFGTTAPPPKLADRASWRGQPCWQDAQDMWFMFFDINGRLPASGAERTRAWKSALKCYARAARAWAAADGDPDANRKLDREVTRDRLRRLTGSELRAMQKHDATVRRQQAWTVRLRRLAWEHARRAVRQGCWRLDDKQTRRLIVLLAQGKWAAEHPATGEPLWWSAALLAGSDAADEWQMAHEWVALWPMLYSMLPSTTCSIAPSLLSWLMACDAACQSDSAAEWLATQLAAAYRFQGLVQQVRAHPYIATTEHADRYELTAAEIDRAGLLLRERRRPGKLSTADLPRAVVSICLGAQIRYVTVDRSQLPDSNQAPLWQHYDAASLPSTLPISALHLHARRSFDNGGFCRLHYRHTCNCTLDTPGLQRGVKDGMCDEMRALIESVHSEGCADRVKTRLQLGGVDRIGQYISEFCAVVRFNKERL